MARLYGADPEDGVGGDGAFFLLLDEPEVYGLPPDPVVTTRDLGSIWSTSAPPRAHWPPSASRRSWGGADEGAQPMVPEPEFESYYGRQILKTPDLEDPRRPALPVPGRHGRRLGAARRGRGADRTVRRWSGSPGAAAAGRRGRHRRSWSTTSGAPSGSSTCCACSSRPRRCRSARSSSRRSRAARRQRPRRCVTGRLPRLGRLAGVGAAAFGPPLATYTAALLANTAVPAWHEAHRELPFVFAGSGAGAAGGVAMVLAPAAQSGPALRMALAGAALEIAASR